MSTFSRRSIAPLLAVAVAFASLVTPISNVANAADARVVVAGASALPASARVVPQRLTTNFDVALTLRNAAGLNSFLTALSTPSSPFYRHFLTPTQFAARYGASPTTLQRVRSYLERFGLHVRRVTTSRTLLEMSGRTTAIARAFDTPVETVHLADGSLRAQFTRPATLPASIAHDVSAVAGLSSVVSPSSRLVSAHATAPRAAHVTLPSTCANAATSGASGGYTVQQQAQLYGLAGAWSAGQNGAGQTIAVYELGQYSAADSAVYFQCYGLNPSISTVSVDGGAQGGFSNEATMDVEAAGALAPGAALKIYQAPNASSGPVDLFAQIANDNTASIVSTSWGDCEIDPSGAVQAEQVIFQQMAAQGQTVIAAAGDNGSSDCTGIVSNAPAVDDPASQPYVTGVGGLSVTSISPLTQTVWNSNGGAGGGGVSQIWSRPTWQSAPGIAPGATMRMVPDLSVMADPLAGFINYFTSNANACQGWCSIGGTSIGAPLVSALVATAAQVCNTPRLGFINPTLYALARSGKGFVDVTTGSNDLFGTGQYSAGVGYDMASGLGSPDPTFVNDLCPSPASPAHSSLISSTATNYALSPSHFTVALRDANGNPVTDTAVTLIVHAHAGNVLIDSDPSSARAASSSLYTVTSDTSGNATFTLTASEPTSVVLTVKLHGAPLYSTTLVVHPVPLNRLAPVTPVVTGVSPRHRGAVITLKPHAANTPFVVAVQISLDGGQNWHSYPGRATSIVLTNLKGASTYLVRVRARNAIGYSPISRALRFTTLS
ncbi:MAG: protease pro-enzyme activation domain-containing protein [Actinomycetota bacterium]|jgi:hypothetical protein|nr:protease pro-enzyme activation domain-containing protein [Actinomycetota bacterium]